MPDARETPCRDDARRWSTRRPGGPSRTIWRAALALVLVPLASLPAGCGYPPSGYGRVPVASTRVDPVRLGAPPSLDPGLTRRAGPYIRPSGPYIGRPAYRAPIF